MAAAAHTESLVRFPSFPTKIKPNGGVDDTPPDSPVQADTPLEAHMDQSPLAETPGTHLVRNLFDGLGVSSRNHVMHEAEVRKLFHRRPVKTLQTAQEAAEKRADASRRRQKSARGDHFGHRRQSMAASP